MIRLGVLLLLCAIGQARAEPAAFDADTAAKVYAEALGFIAPRILEPVPVSVMTLWGLRGVAAIDPSLQVAAERGRLVLRRQGAAVAEIAMPQNEAPGDWARAAADLMASASRESAPLRSVGAQGAVGTFFDELFSRIDPYSRYVPPAEAEADRAARTGRAGLGIGLGQRGAATEVRSVLPDSPAALAGVRPRDALLAVNGQRVGGLAAAEAMLLGPDGSEVTLSVRGRDGRARDIALARAMLPPQTVFPRRGEDVLVLRVSGFSASTAAQIASAVQGAMAEPNPVSGIVIDLRDNRGGLLRQAVASADIFLPAGPVAVTVGRDPDANHVLRSTEGELARNVPLVVLVDGRTASSAEILAAALADRGRAVVVGSATVGKGLVQTIDPLPDGGELFVTWSRVLAPLGWPLQGLGVLPQVCTSAGDGALARALGALSSGMQPMAAAIARQRAARVPVGATEALEIRAPCPSAEAGAADMGAALALIANPAAYAAALLPPME